MKKLTTFAAAGAVLFAVAAPASAQTIAIMDGTVHTVSGDVIENGDVIIRDGRIAQVGADLSAPQGASVIDATGKIVTPGLFAPYGNLGLVEISAVGDSNDTAPSGDFPLGAALDAADAFNPQSTLIPVNRAGGVTRAVSAPAAGGTLFGGKAAVVDLSGRPNSITRSDAAQIAVMGYGGAARSGDTRLGAWAVLREYLDEARSYQNNPNDYVRRPHSGRFALSDVKALVPVVSGEQPLFVEVNSAVGIRTLIKLKNAYRLRVVIVGASEGWRVADDIASANIPVILDPLANLPSQFEDLDSTLENAARLDAAGVAISFYNQPGFGAHNLRLMTQQAGNAVAHGLPHAAALAAITRNPAQMLGLGDQLGTLEAGKIADVVIWDGDPLEVTTEPEAVFINGRPQDLGNRQKMLLERYRDLSRGDAPFAYRGGE